MRPARCSPSPAVHRRPCARPAAPSPPSDHYELRALVDCVPRARPTPWGCLLVTASAGLPTAHSHATCPSNTSWALRSACCPSPAAKQVSATNAQGSALKSGKLHGPVLETGPNRQSWVTSKAGVNSEWVRTSGIGPGGNTGLLETCEWLPTSGPVTALMSLGRVQRGAGLCPALLRGVEASQHLLLTAL